MIQSAPLPGGAPLGEATRGEDVAVAYDGGIVGWLKDRAGTG